MTLSAKLHTQPLLGTFRDIRTNERTNELTTSEYGHFAISMLRPRINSDGKVFFDDPPQFDPPKSIGHGPEAGGLLPRLVIGFPSCISCAASRCSKRGALR